MQANRHQVKSRTPTPGPELELLEEALQSAQSSSVWPAQDQPIFFREPALPTGFPDLVGVFLNQREPEFVPERMRLGSAHLQLLHYVFLTRGTSLSSAAKALLQSGRDIERLVEDLELARLVRRRSNQVRCVALAKIFFARRIVAVEAKMDKWTEAIRQAVTNTWFASHSFVLLPDRRWGTNLESLARRFGIGVLTYDGAHTRMRLRAEKRRLPASYGSWMVNEWTIRQASRRYDNT